MRSARFAIPAIALFAFAACSDTTSTDGLIDDSALTLDVAASAGDATAEMIGIMIANEASAGGGPDGAGANMADAPASNLDVTRSRTCLDANNAVVQNCLPFSSVRKIAIAATINGTRSASRSKEGGATVTWTGVVHRTSNDTTTRVFSGSTETSRVHTDVALGNDTTTFTDGVLTRRISEAVRDSVRSLTFNLPRSSNPYPASGSIVRNATVNVLVTSGDRSASATRSHRIEVLFPADAQGNVVLKINAKTCQLNLVTRAVSNCQ